MVVYPGGFGTMDELFELLTLIQTKSMKQIPVIMVGKQWWNNIINFKFLIEEGLISEKDLEIFDTVDNAKEAWNSILEWYKKRNKPLLIS